MEILFQLGNNLKKFKVTNNTMYSLLSPNMRQLHTPMVMAIFAVAAIAGIIGTVAVVFLTTTAESASAWHSQFQSKKECTNFMKNVLGNTTAEANVMCNKVVPH